MLAKDISIPRVPNGRASGGRGRGLSPGSSAYRGMAAPGPTGTSSQTDMVLISQSY